MKKTLDQYEQYVEHTTMDELAAKAKELAANQDFGEILRLISAANTVFYGGYIKNALVNSAAEYFSENGNDIGIKSMIKHGADLNKIGKSYGKRGEITQVLELEKEIEVKPFDPRDSLLSGAIEGLAESDIVYSQKKKDIDRLIGNGAPPYFAICGYLKIKDYGAVSDLINRYSILLNKFFTYENIYNINFVADAIRSATQNFSDEEAGMAILSQIKSVSDRKKLVGYAPQSDAKRLLEKADRLTQLMNDFKISLKQALLLLAKIKNRMEKYHFDYEQAVAFSNPSLQVWLMQAGDQLWDKFKLAPDMLCYIASYIFSLQDLKIKEIYSQINNDRNNKIGFFQANIVSNNKNKTIEESKLCSHRAIH